MKFLLFFAIQGASNVVKRDYENYDLEDYDPYSIQNEPEVAPVGPVPPPNCQKQCKTVCFPTPAPSAKTYATVKPFVPSGKFLNKLHSLKSDFYRF